MSHLPLVFHPNYSIPFPDGHRFPMRKFALLAKILESKGILTSDNVYSPNPLSLKLLMQVHDASYVQRFIRGELTSEEERTIGLPWSTWLVERTLRAVSGTVLTAELAVEHGLAAHLAGGTHHAHKAYGQGFCIFNDLAVAAIHLLNRQQAKRILIVDCDVHQGDGTASMLSNVAGVETASWHCEENYPPTKHPAGLNFPIPKYTGDADYLAKLQADLSGLLMSYQPDFVFYDAGVDVHKDDRLGYLELSDAGIYQRDRFVIEACRSRHIPVAIVIGGGYDRDEEKVALRHGIVHQAAHDYLTENLIKTDHKGQG